MHIDIIGAGIGGLTTALAFEKKGISSRIFEQSPKIKPVGAGIILANNAMQVYKKLGLKETIEAHGNVISSLNITRANLQPLSEVDLTYFEQKHQTKNIAIHRGVLQGILIDHLKNTPIALNHRLSSLKKGDNDYLLNFENGIQQSSSTIIGADGLNSVIRKEILPSKQIRNAPQVCWRGVTEFQLPQDFKNELNEAWGKTARFGFVQIAQNKVYWYALKSFKKNKNEFSVEELGLYFKDFAPLIQNIIRATPLENIHIAEISDLPPTRTWFKGNICLIGDAAHAATPNMGQGACQAIEDAYVLSECMGKYQTNEAFAAYQKLRLPKANQVVKTSWMIGKMAHVSNPFLMGLRNQILKSTPPLINRMQNEKIFQLAEI